MLRLKRSELTGNREKVRRLPVQKLKKQAFLNIDIFKKVLEYYKGSNLPDMKYLGNVLTKEFGLDPETHEEFAKIFRENCQYLGITSGVPQAATPGGEEPSEPSAGTVTLAEGAAGSKLTAFVILPFVERDAKHPKGFSSKSFAASSRRPRHRRSADLPSRQPTARAATSFNPPS